MAVGLSHNNVVAAQIDINLLQPHPRNVEIYGEEDVIELVDYIRDSKWIKPLVISQNNRIISGHRRWQAARILGLMRVPYVMQVFETEEDELKALLLENASRDKTPEQKVREGVEWKKIEERESLKRMAEGANSTNKVLDRVAIDTGVDAHPHPSSDGKTRDKVAERVGFGSGKSYEKAAKVVERADKLEDEGKVAESKALLKILNEQSVTAASFLIQEPEAQQEAILQTIASHIANDYYEAKSIVRREQEQAHIAQLKARGVQLPTGQYSCIVMDPPWQMQKIERDVRPNQMEFDYPTMDEYELKAFPLPTFAADNCHLYLWTTQKHMPMALRLAEHWGFRYQCLMTWVKNVGFTPFSWMYSTEHVLFCIKGSMPLMRKGLRLDFKADVREHSRKPDVFYDRVREASPGPRIDVFSREQRDGFDQYGNEVEKYVAV